MSADLSRDEPPEDGAAVLAAEYVLRLLDPAAEAACAAREARDPLFAAEVDRWRQDFAGLDAAFMPVPPPAALRARVEAALFGAPPSALARLWGSVGLWRAVAAAATVAAIGFAVVRPPVAPEPRPSLVAAVQPVAGEVSLVALHAPGSESIEFRRLGGAAASGRSLELWILPMGETVPASLGLVPAGERFTATIPPAFAARVGEGTAILVSDEPAGGSPTGLPTGPVVAQGAITAL